MEHRGCDSLTHGWASHSQHSPCHTNAYKINMLDKYEIIKIWLTRDSLKIYSVIKQNGKSRTQYENIIEGNCGNLKD